MARSMRGASTASPPLVKPRQPRDTRTPSKLSDATLHDLEQLSDLAEKKGWYSFAYTAEGRSIKVTLPLTIDAHLVVSAKLRDHQTTRLRLKQRSRKMRGTGRRSNG